LPTVRAMGTSRRSFLRQLLAAAATATTPSIAQLLSAAFPPERHPLGRFRILLSQYPALGEVTGSVKVPIPGATGEVPPRLIVTRVAEDRFAAVDDICPHAGCPVSTYQSSLQALPCPCHGSLFSPTGQVLRGPARSPLRSFQTFYEQGSDVLEVEIPGYVSVPEIPTPLTATLTPNPATEWLEITGTAPEATVVRFSITTLQGQTVVQWQQWVPAGRFYIRYPLRGFASGTYWLRLEDSAGGGFVHAFQVLH